MSVCVFVRALSEKERMPTYKRLKRTLFIRTKHNVQISGVIPFVKVQKNKKEKKKRIRLSCVFFWGGGGEWYLVYSPFLNVVVKADWA